MKPVIDVQILTAVLIALTTAGPSLGEAIDWQHQLNSLQSPVNLGTTVNSALDDNAPDVSADGLTLYFWSTRPGGFGDRDLYQSSRASIRERFGPPTNLGGTINTSYSDFGPSVSSDGLTLYFASDKPGGLGDSDLYMATRNSAVEPFANPVNLGATVNSGGVDASPGISSDGLRLYFQSERAGGFGSMDLWLTTRPSVSDPFGTPVNLGTPFNSIYYDGGARESNDGLVLFTSSARPIGSSQSIELYYSLRTTTADVFGTPTPMWNLNSSAVDFGAAMAPDGLYFHSDRAGGNGGRDLYVSPLPPRMMISTNSTGLELLWTPSAWMPFKLQTADTLSQGSWSDALSGTNSPVILPGTAPSRFFRLNRLEP